MGLLTLITSGLLVTGEQRCKISWTICRIPAWPFDYIVKAEKLARRKYLETKEHIGGFWVFEVADSGRGAGLEVREFGIRE